MINITEEIFNSLHCRLRAKLIDNVARNVPNKMLNRIVSGTRADMRRISLNIHTSAKHAIEWKI